MCKIKYFIKQVVEEEAAKRIELLVKKRVEEELEKRKDEIEQEVAKRVEEAKRKMEKEMMEELERQREEQKREELARQVTALFPCQSCVNASKEIAFSHDNSSAMTTYIVIASNKITISVKLNVLYQHFKQKLIKVLFRSYLLKVLSGVVRAYSTDLILFVKCL